MSAVGGMMLVESLRALNRARKGQPFPARRPSQHNWIHGLPFKTRFKVSKLYISALPPVVLGALVGLMSGVMGVGGGFVMVPILIYLLRVPTNVAIGTSLFQVIFVSAITTVLQAATNQTVDIALALRSWPVAFSAHRPERRRVSIFAASNCVSSLPSWFSRWISARCWSPFASSAL